MTTTATRTRPRRLTATNAAPLPGVRYDDPAPPEPRREQTFQQLLRLALASALPCVRLWRQPAGQVRTDRGSWVECAPVGAADLSGIVSPEGWRLEVEVKGERTPVDRSQYHWLETLRGYGAVTLLVRDDGTPEAVARGVEAIRAAVQARRAAL